MRLIDPSSMAISKTLPYFISLTGAGSHDDFLLWMNRTNYVRLGFDSLHVDKLASVCVGYGLATYYNWNFLEVEACQKRLISDIPEVLGKAGFVKFRGEYNNDLYVNISRVRDIYADPIPSHNFYGDSFVISFCEGNDMRWRKLRYQDDYDIEHLCKDFHAGKFNRRRHADRGQKVGILKEATVHHIH